MSNITLYSLSDYNAGDLISFTIELDDIDHDEYLKEITDNLARIDKEKGIDIYTPKREEWIVCDFDDIPKHYVGEYDIDLQYWDYKIAIESSEHDEDVFNAGLNCDVALEDIDEAYSGQFNSDEEFAEDLADQLDLMPNNSQWPSYFIDWERAAHELMMDYCASNGHYFRNL